MGNVKKRRLQDVDAIAGLMLLCVLIAHLLQVCNSGCHSMLCYVMLCFSVCHGSFIKQVCCGSHQT